MESKQFPQGFLWGTATSSYQIEGAPDEDGKGPSIWDEFSHTPGKTLDGETGDIACDHYHRYKEDVGLISALGCKAYRFSVSWPRIFPDGSGKVNGKGLDFYDRLVDELKGKGIEPFLTLFHWDLPLALNKKGGWTVESIIPAFAEYAQTVAERLKDRVRHWMTFNELLVVVWCGYIIGIHAPGLKNLELAFKAYYNIMLAHGQAAKALKALDPGLKVGLAEGYFPFYPARPRDARHIGKWEESTIGLVLDPLFKGRLPESMEKFIMNINKGRPVSGIADLKGSVDFYGLNLYSRQLLRRKLFSPLGYTQVRPSYPGVRFTEMDWEIFPDAMHKALTNISKAAPGIPIYVTENGSAFNDTVSDGKIHDADRVDFLARYLSAAHRAIQDGCNVKGYFYWSLMDNFEWSHGYSKRFGLYRVDFPAQKRTIKDSGLFYSRVCRDNALTPSP
jgi:beta-glucosidase